MELYSQSIANAVESWKIVQQLPDYKTLVGELLFREIFHLSPGAINMFGFGAGVDCYNLPETLFKLPAFQLHTNGVVTMLEQALEMMMGKDMDALVVELSTLGAKHVTYGIQPPHYILVESALLRTLEIGLGEEGFTKSLRKDWEGVFRFISRTMMMGASKRVQIVKTKRRTAEKKKVATLRLNSITPGKRNRALTRNSRTGNGRFEVEPSMLPSSMLSSTSSTSTSPSSNSRRRRSSFDAPQQPMRRSFDPSPHDSHSAPTTLLDTDINGEEELVDALEDLTVSSTAETAEETDSSDEAKPGEKDSHDYWAWGTDSTIEPPRKPKRVPTHVMHESSLSPPPKPQRSAVIVHNTSFDSLSTLGSVDSAPERPKRSRSPQSIHIMP